jgi:Spy/CpxP family protein refolding chaperone
VNAPSGAPRRAGLYAALALLAAMLLGGAAGFALGRWREARGPRIPAITLLGPSRAELLDSLDLTPDQRAQIERLLDDAQARANTSVDAMLGEVRRVTDETRREVRGVLDDRQRVRFDSLIATARPVRPRAPVPPRREGP